MKRVSSQSLSTTRLTVPQRSVDAANPKAVWLSGEAGQGLVVRGTFSRSGSATRMDMTFSNKTANVALSSFALQLNKNSFGLVPSEALRCSPLAPGQSFETSLRFAVIEIVPTGTNGCASQILFPDTNGAIHLVWSQWDSHCGTISKFWGNDWDT